MYIVYCQSLNLKTGHMFYIAKWFNPQLLKFYLNSNFKFNSF